MSVYKKISNKLKKDESITLQGRSVMFKEYTQYDALALAALVNAGEVSAKELLDAAVNQANELNP